MEGTKQQQNHRTQDWTNSYQREMDWGGWVGRAGKKKEGIMINMYSAWGHEEGCATQRRQVVI